MGRITKIAAAENRTRKKLRVAAYARVSTASDEQLISLEAQKNHYEKYIRAHRDWEYAGLYFDEGISGTGMAKRDGLLALLADCECGLIDYIIVKSISRFSRNTVDSIETVRKLCGMGIYIFFEKENIDTGKMEGELLLSILSSLAESESRSISENELWGIQKRFQNGTYVTSCPPYGYKNVSGEMIIDEEKAVTVRMVFREFLGGKSSSAIAKLLNEMGIASARGGRWYAGTVRGLLRNEKYIGDVLFQKTYTDEQFTRHRNYGEKAQYYSKGHHEPIISREDFEKAGQLLDFNAEEKGITTSDSRYLKRYAFSGKVYCNECGGKFKRKIVSGEPAYACNTHVDDKERCSQLSVREASIEAAFTTMMNKLTFGRETILLPLQKALDSAGREKMLDRINEIDALLETLLNKKQSVSMFFSKGLLDPAIYQEELDSIITEERSLSDERSGMTRSINGGQDRTKALAGLLRYTAKEKMQTGFDDRAFSEFVERVVIYSRTEVGFVMKCGPEFRERMV